MQNKCAAISMVIFSLVMTIRIPCLWSDILNNSDDGTEVDETDWYENGFQPSINYLGQHSNDKRYDGGFRFYLEDLYQGEEIVYAHLRFASMGGEITSTAKLLIEGVLQDSPTTFSQDERPSQKIPKTDTKIDWVINESWLEGSDNVPLYYSSPNIAPIINEILALENWGTGPEGKTLIITVKDNGTNPNEINRIFFEDFWNEPDAISTPVILEIYNTIYDTFLGKEFLGRITNTSVTVNLYSLIETDTYIEYGVAPGIYTNATPQYLNQPAERPIEIILDDLAPDTQYYYRLCYRKAGETRYEHGEEHTFHTQRPSGSSFTFVITADEHVPYRLQRRSKRILNRKRILNLYVRTLKNIAVQEPDFLISLGDHAIIHATWARDIATLEEAKQLYLNLRECLNKIAHSIPFFLVLGNHEGEVGWKYNFETPGQNHDSLAVLSAQARKEIIPNPYPDEFYTGNLDTIPEYGLRENYYAWEWGDALFVVLDPFWYTKTHPQKAQSNWAWTLGKKQYEWLFNTLHHSNARWKFIFIHHLTSSNTVGARAFWYGRGGIEVAKYNVSGCPTFEWGGEDVNGHYVFPLKRPNWQHGPIHNMLVSENVSIVFHGHDHFFAKQDLDGIVYQVCPQPSNILYDYGYKDRGGYEHGVFLPNSGHLRVTVNPNFVRVEYVRSYLPGDGENGNIAYSYELK